METYKIVAQVIIAILLTIAAFLAFISENTVERRYEFVLRQKTPQVVEASQSVTAQVLPVARWVPVITQRASF